MFSRAPSSLIKPGTVTDVYSISPEQQDKVALIGGGGNLNNAWSAIATVPGVFVTPNTTSGLGAYIGSGASVSVRGGDYDQIGYEIDGVPVNRSFDNYPSGAISSLGQQELQVYTGVPPAGANANGISGFINQVIRTGTYPGFSNLDIGVGGPAYYHHASFEIGGSSPNRNFSYYIGIGGYNEYIKVANQFDGANYDSLYGAPVAPCFPGISATVAPSCYGGYTNATLANPQGTYVAGGYNGNVAYSALGYPPGYGSFVLGPFNYGSFQNIADRDNVVNLHFGFPHKNGTKDDIQLLGMVNWINNTLTDSTNDLGGVAYANAINLGQPFYIDGYQFNLQPGQPLPSNYQSLAGTYSFPNVPAHSFDAFQPINQRSGFENDQAEYKIQWTHNMSSSALFRVYAFSNYTDWLNTDPQEPYADFVGINPDYELSSHIRGVSGSFIDQINSQNLLNFTGSYTTATTVRDNNTEFFDGFYIPAFFGPTAGTIVNPRTALAVLVNANNPTNGVCYTSTGAATSCTPGVAAQYATLYEAYSGTIPAVPAGATACGGGPCEYFVVGNGQYATYNQVQPNFYSGSLTDDFHPTSKLTISAAVKFNDYQYVGASTQGTAARTLFYNAFNMDTCQDSIGNLYEKVLIGGTISSTCSTLHATGQVGNLTSITVTNPTATTLTSPSWEPRLGATYSLDPFTVLRASYGRYSQAPNSAFVQYNALEQDLPYLLYNTYNNQKYGFLTPDHAVMPEYSNNYDISLEHQFRGDTSIKVTPFWRSTQNQVQQFFLDQETGFVSGLNVGKQTSRGIEFELDKGNFAAQGLSARLTFAYTNSYINYTPLSNGSSVITPLNAAIQQYNAYTRGCAAGGTYAGTTLCGTTATGAADGQTTYDGVANPYYNAPTQGLLNPNANYPTFDILPSAGIAGEVDTYGAPYVATLVLNERVGKFAIVPIVQMFAGQRYGAPATTEGVAPDTCTATLGSTIAGDPRYPYGAPAGAPFDATTCSLLASGIPDPYTQQFDGLGAFVQPAELLLHVQLSYEISKSVTLLANVSNIVNSCFGGTKVGFAVGNACAYGSGSVGTGDIGNVYNPGAVIQPYENTPYLPAFTQVPMNIYVSAKIKI